MEVMAAGGLEGGEGRLGGRAKAIPLGRGNSRRGDLGGLEADKLGEEREAGGVGCRWGQTGRRGA